MIRVTGSQFISTKPSDLVNASFFGCSIAATTLNPFDDVILSPPHARQAGNHDRQLNRISRLGEVELETRA
jgi:hypothetical protein